MIAFLRRVIAFRARTTGQPLQVIYQEFVDAMRGIKRPYPGDRPSCAVCGSEHTTVASTQRDKASVTRYHCCQFCGLRFQTVEQVEPVKTTNSVTEKPAEVHKENRGKRKRKRG